MRRFTEGGNMRKLGLGILPLTFLLASCPQTPTPSHRLEIRTLGGNSAQLIPTQGQLPYCLVFTIAANGTIRQLTMSHDDHSISCPADKPIGGVRYRFPISEGRVRILVLFSDRKLDAGSVAAQVMEKGSLPTLSATDLRLPGRVTVEVLDFAPMAEPEPSVGTVVGRRGESRDGGSADRGGSTPPR
jgi:hypothetical protein